MQKFKNRFHAGKILAEKLIFYKGKLNVLVLALPRGGVPVAFEFARQHHLPLDVYLVRKLGVPGHEELAMGAIASGDAIVFNSDILNELSITSNQINAVIEKEKHELARRNKCYRNDMPSPIIANKIIILVDDGLATGATMLAAITALKKANPAKIIVAIPIGAAEVCEKLKQEVDEVVCLFSPEPFYGVGNWYEDFSQTTDAEVIELLQQATVFPSLANKKARN